MKNVIITILSSILSVLVGAVVGAFGFAACELFLIEKDDLCAIEKAGCCPHDCRACSHGPAEEDILI